MKERVKFVLEWETQLRGALSRVRNQSPGRLRLGAALTNCLHVMPRVRIRSSRSGELGEFRITLREKPQGCLRLLIARGYWAIFAATAFACLMQSGMPVPK